MLSKLKSIKLKYKLYLLVLIQVALLIFVYAYTNMVVEKEMLQRLTEHNSRLNFQNVSVLRDAIGEMKNIFDTTLSLENPAVGQHIELIFRQMNKFQNINVSFRDNSKLWLTNLRDHTYIKRIAMCSKTGPAVFMHADSEVYFITMVDPAEEWMTESMDRRGNYFMTTNDGLFRLCRAVINPLKYDKLGVMTVDADFSFVMDNFQAQKLFTNQRYGLYVNGVKVAGDTEMNMNEVREIVSFKTPYQSILMDKESGMIYLYYHQATPDEIISFTAIPYDAIFGQVFSQNLSIIFATCLYVLVFFLMVTLIVRNIVKSLGVFEKAFNQIENGQFGITVGAQVEGELQSFLASFNRMSVRLGELISEVYEKNLVQHELELQMLRNQINPHFFYNTLEALRMNCMLGREQQNIQMIEYLSEILRYGVSSSAEPVRLKDEIKHLEYYVLLHNLRLDTQIQLRVFIPPDLMEEETIKLMFQPLVENAIQHGLSPDGKPLEICVMGYKEKGNIVFSIVDNGIGISEQNLAQINRALEGCDDVINVGIGMKNVHRRIQLFYGDAYGLSIQSHQGQGTEVQIVVPYKGDFVP